MVVPSSPRSMQLMNGYRDSSHAVEVLLQEYIPGKGEYCLRWHLGTHKHRPGVGVYQEVIFRPWGDYPFEEPNLHERRYADIDGHPRMSFGLVSRDDREFILEYACDLVDECAGKQNANHLWMAKLLRKLSNEKIVQNDFYHDALHRFFPAQRALHI